MERFTVETLSLLKAYEPSLHQSSGVRILSRAPPLRLQSRPTPNHMEMQDYEQRWRHYRLLSNVRIVLIAGIFAVPFCAVFFPLPDVPPNGARLIVGVWVGTLVLIEFRLTTWRCPRCGKWFFTKMGSTGLFKSWRVKSCVHCGLPKYSNGVSHGESAPLA